MTQTNIHQLSDQEVVKALLQKDARLTNEFLYGKCFPLFKAVFNKYYTDCDSVEELISDIYLYIMTPGKKTGVSKLEAFGFKCSLTMWLKIVVENYCHQLYAKKMEVSENFDLTSDRFLQEAYSLSTDNASTDAADVNAVLAMMPNERYRTLIRLRYLEEKSNEETAELMNMSMANYYNTHKRAKEQFCVALKKERL
ncbi:MAG: sigma-70 family RNA polymerase sigma factor [Muribaculaceae bacterium]|nr:sigma-70 family RNA polymerase sigma factor [Muribaculaceae bacterium]